MTRVARPRARPEPAHRLARHLAGAIVLVLLAVLPVTDARAQARGTVKIATQSPLSGELAILGEGIRLGVQLAVDRFKGAVERAGLRVEVVPFDDQAKPAVGVANAKHIVADRAIVAVVGHLNSSVAIPASEVYREAGLVMVSPANTDPLVTDRGLATVNRVCGRDDVQGAVAARFAKEGLGARTAYVVHDTTPYGQGVAELFQAWSRRNGVEVLGFEGTAARADVEPVLTSVKARNPDVVFFAGEHPQAASVLRQARERGIKARFLGPDGLDSSELLRLGGEAVVGLHFTTVTGGAVEYPRAREFAQAYVTRFGKEPEVFAAQAYDAAAIVLRAIEASISTGGGQPPGREAVARAVRKVKHDGITGRVEFDDKGDLRRATYFVREVARDWTANRLVRRFEMPAPARP